MLSALRSPLSALRSPLSALSFVIAVSTFAQGQTITSQITSGATSVTHASTMPRPLFGNSIEPGGGWTVTAAGGATYDTVVIETTLEKDAGGGMWAAVGATQTATYTGTSNGTWSSARYKNLAKGKYRVKAVLKYNQTNPAPVKANPQTSEDIFTVTFTVD